MPDDKQVEDSKVAEEDSKVKSKETKPEDSEEPELETLSEEDAAKAD